MITEKIYCRHLTDECQETILDLIDRLNWQAEIYSDMIEVNIPEKDSAIFGFIFDTI